VWQQETSLTLQIVLCQDGFCDVCPKEEGGLLFVKENTRCDFIERIRKAMYVQGKCTFN